MFGWIISILLIISGILGLRNASTILTYYDDGRVDKTKDSHGGCLSLIVGLIWLGIKIYNLF